MTVQPLPGNQQWTSVFSLQSGRASARVGRIVLDKFGNEKGDAEDRPRVAAHQAVQGSRTEPERTTRGQGPDPDGGPGPQVGVPAEESKLRKPQGPKARD